jgi:hypothetical protein
MFRAKMQFKNDHVPLQVSKKAMTCFLSTGLQIMAAKPVCYYHQTLSFPQCMLNATQAKAIFNKFMKATDKKYKKYKMMTFYIQERRFNGAVHYHVCFLFFDSGNLPFCPSRMERNFRTDIFKRWDKANGGNCVHPANAMEVHDFDLETLRYFVKAIEIPDLPPERKEVIWWGVRNSSALAQRLPNAATKQEIQTTFKELFCKRRKDCKSKIEEITEWNDPEDQLQISDTKLTEEVGSPEILHREDKFENFLDTPEKLAEFEARMSEVNF